MKYVRIAAGILLLPLVLSMAWNLAHIGLNAAVAVSERTAPFWLGLAGYFLFQIVFFRPLRTYVFGHELTHALVGLLSGARLRKFKVSSKGGSVVLSKTNLWITLAPYCIPLYSVLLVAGWWIAGRFYPLDRYFAWLLFGVGFSLGFHVSLTVYAISQGQSDLKVFGRFFSLIVIMLANCAVMALVFKLLFPADVHLWHYVSLSAREAWGIWQRIYNEAYHLWEGSRTTK